MELPNCIYILMHIYVIITIKQKEAMFSRGNRGGGMVNEEITQKKGKGKNDVIIL